MCWLSLAMCGIARVVRAALPAILWRHNETVIRDYQIPSLNLELERADDESMRTHEVNFEISHNQYCSWANHIGLCFIRINEYTRIIREFIPARRYPNYDELRCDSIWRWLVHDCSNRNGVCVCVWRASLRKAHVECARKKIYICKTPRK